MRLAPSALCVLLASSALAQDSLDLAPLKKWILLQKELRTLEADFVQTRSLRTLRSPVAVPGKLWFNSGGDLHWELGNPPKTIFLRNKEGSFLIHPQKLRYETIAIDKAAPGAPQNFPMLEFPIASSFGDFCNQFEVTKIKTEGAQCHLEFIPKEAQARKYVQTIRLDFETQTGELQFLEFVSRDGSSLKTEFSNVRTNRKLDNAVFAFDLNGYRADSPKP